METVSETDGSDGRESTVESQLCLAPEVSMSFQLFLILLSKEVAFLLHADYLSICREGAIYPGDPFSFLSHSV